MVVGLLCMAAVESAGQYFGRNKVQYEPFDFRETETPHFRIYHYTPEKPAVRDAAFMLERWHERLCAVFGDSLGPHQPVIIYGNHADFQQTNVAGGLIPQSTGGFTEGRGNRIVLPLTGVHADNDHVLGHELTHAFHYQIIRNARRGLTGARGIPLWFIEGMAEYLSVGAVAPHTSMWLRDALLNDDLPDLRAMSSDPKYFPYRYGHAVWAYIAGRWGDDVVPTLFRAALKNGFRDAFAEVLGMEEDSLSTLWQEAVKAAYTEDARRRQPPDSVGKPLITGGGGLNLSPSISPDGRYVAFLARREVFTLDLYLADALDGEVITSLASSNTDEHFDALRFMRSSGAWSPDSRRFAFVVFDKGDNAVAIVDVCSPDDVRTIRVDPVEALTDLAWSPDGRRLAMSGIQEGVSDLYMLDVESERVSRLTRGASAELQPAWSPDGGRLAFVTDRGSKTDLDNLVYGAMQIALMDTATGSIELLGFGPDVKHVDPAFSPDGRSIFFVAAPDGVSDIFRLEPATHRIYRVTTIATGISGLSETAPVLSVSAQTGDLVFTVFDNAEYAIHRLAAEKSAGTPIDSGMVFSRQAVVLPPREEKTAPQTVAAYLEHPSGEFDDDRIGQQREYRPRMRLLYLGSLGIGVSVDQYGTSMGGSVHARFSDILNNHMLGVTASASGEIQDFGARLTYANRTNRANWGATVAHVPSLSSRFSAQRDTVAIDGESVAATRTTLVRRRTFHERVGGAVSYPFSRNRRIEFMPGYRHEWYRTEGEEAVRVDGEVVERATFEPTEPTPLNLFHAAVAYVGDYSFFGFTSPADGHRYRFEIEPGIGTLSYVSVLADVRRYVFVRPVTVAFRAFHYGRYLGDAESERLSELFLGFPDWVRGYGYRSLEPGRCGDEDCDRFERLFGSRVAVTNAELRIPLLGTRDYGILDFRYLPTSVVAFFDAGVAWRKGVRPDWVIGDSAQGRIPVMSAGGAIRLNLLGVVVLQGYVAHAFQRIGDKWQFGLILAPGW